MPAAPQALLLVDGYNVIGAWQDLVRLRDQEGLEVARHELIEVLLGYTAAQDYHTHVVFDSQYRNSPSSREPITGYLTICYTDYRQTADTYIERACSEFRKDLRKFSQRLIVATSDRAQQLMVAGYGAEWMSAHRLWAEVELTTQRVQRKQQALRKQQSKSTRRFLGSALDAAAQERLTQLRFGRTSNPDASQNGKSAH